MSHRVVVLAALAASALLLVVPSTEAATVYDFSTVQGAGTPTTLNGATFSSPQDVTTPGGAFTFGPNAGLYTNLGPYVLSSANPATLNVSFATAQTGISFDFAVGDGFALNGNDQVTVTTNTGLSFSALANVVTPSSGNPDIYPEGLFSLANAGPFKSLTITATDASGSEGLVLADLSTTPVPLPGALLLFGGGFAGLMGFGRRAKSA